jgi:hypothetical protein
VSNTDRIDRPLGQSGWSASNRACNSTHGATAATGSGQAFRADARGNEAMVDARIRDLVAFIDSIQKK